MNGMKSFDELLIENSDLKRRNESLSKSLKEMLKSNEEVLAQVKADAISYISKLELKY